MKSNPSPSPRRPGKRMLYAGSLLLAVAAGWGAGQLLSNASGERDAAAVRAQGSDTAEDQDSLAVLDHGDRTVKASTAVTESFEAESTDTGIDATRDQPAAKSPGSERLSGRKPWVDFDLQYWLGLAHAAHDRDTAPEVELISGPASSPLAPAVQTTDSLDQPTDSTTPARDIRTFLARRAAGGDGSPTLSPADASAPSPATPIVTPAAPPADLSDAQDDAASAQEPEGPADPLESLRERYVNRLISFYPIGFSSTNPSSRHVGWGLSSSGWAGFVQNRVMGDLDWGYRRIQLHNPFGDDGEFPMELDQSIRAEAAGLDWLTDDFVEVWRPVTRGDYTQGEPVEVIAYMGTARLSPFLDLQADGDWEGWLARAQASVAKPIAAGMSLAFDSFSLEAEDSFSFRFAQIMKDRGIKVYIETWPRRAATHWHSTNIIVAEHWFQRNHRRDNVARPIDLTGDVVRLMNRRIDESELPNATKLRVIEGLVQGYTVSMRSDRMEDAVGDLDSLLNAIRVSNQAAYD